MGRQKYNTCMVPFMKGGGPDRKLRFCTGAKLCSGKAKSEQEAREICLTEPPKEPKRRRLAGTGPPDPAIVAACVAEAIQIENLTAENLQAQLTDAITRCSLAKSAPASTRPLTYKRFMKSCLKEELGGRESDFIDSQKEIRSCQVKWNSLRG